MSRYLVLLILSVAIATSQGSWILQKPASAASDAQIKFAIENKYDDTGPGAKRREFAYNTFKTLEEALIAYLDDPDTKLPESERVKAYKKLGIPQNRIPDVYRKPALKDTEFTFDAFKSVTPDSSIYNYLDDKGYYSEDNTLGGHKGFESSHIQSVQESFRRAEPFKFQKIQNVKNSPLTLSHYTRDSESQFNHHPKYTYSYGVHDTNTGDMKAVSESRDGGTVHGYYTFVDSDGKQRTVQYVADDKLGFRANVKRSH